MSYSVSLLLFVHLKVSISVCMLVLKSVHPVDLSVCFVFLYFMFVCLSVILSVSLSLSICLSACLSANGY